MASDRFTERSDFAHVRRRDVAVANDPQEFDPLPFVFCGRTFTAISTCARFRFVQITAHDEAPAGSWTRPSWSAPGLCCQSRP